MLEIFSTREISIFFWIIIIFLTISINKNIRKSIINIVKCLFNFKLVITFVILVIYTCIITYILNLIGIEVYSFLKDIILWFILAGVPFTYSSIVTNKEININYFLNYIIDNLKIISVIEFIISTFTFNLLVEIIIVPIITFLVVLDSVASLKSETKQVHKILSYIISFFGFLVLFFALKEAIGTYAKFGTINLLISFMIPIIFSVMYVPVIYIFVIYSKYEILFLRITFFITEENKIRYILLIIKKFKFSLKKINYFTYNCMKEMYINISYDEFEKIILEFEKSYNLKKK